MESKKTAPLTETGKAVARTPARSFMRTDFPHVRAAAIGVAASILFSGALVGTSSGLLANWRAVVSQRTAERSAAQARLSEARIERQELIEFRPAFEQLRRDGLVAEERRLDLMELLRNIQEGRELLPLTYTVTEQQSFVVDPALPTGSMDLRGSKITLSLPLLHEMDLLNLLDDLKGHGLYAPEACNVQRAPSVPGTVLAARLQADCTLYWVTMAERKGSAPPLPKN